MGGAWAPPHNLPLPLPPLGYAVLRFLGPKVAHVAKIWLRLRLIKNPGWMDASRRDVIGCEHILEVREVLQ
jgi:hypothetical protein